MRRTVYTVFVLLAAIASSGCGTEAVVSSPTGSLSSKINGVLWTCQDKADLVFKPWDSNAPIQIHACRTGDGNDEFELDFRNLKDTGMYFLNEKNSILLQCIFSPEIHKFTGMHDSSAFARITQIDSSLKSFDYQKSPSGLKFINLKGTFGFRCLNNFGDTISITEGQFDLVCNPYPLLP